MNLAMLHANANWNSPETVEELLVSVSQITFRNYLQVAEKIRIIQIFTLAYHFYPFSPVVHDVESSWIYVMRKQHIERLEIPTSCPITGEYLELPAKFEQCRHVRCFDAAMAESIQKCPLCDAKAAAPKLDAALAIILQNISRNTKKIILYDSCQWTLSSAESPPEKPAAFLTRAAQSVYLS